MIRTPLLQEATTITLRSSLKALRFRLWDEKSKTFVSFQEAKPVLKKISLQKDDQVFRRNRKLDNRWLNKYKSKVVSIIV